MAACGWLSGPECGAQVELPGITVRVAENGSGEPVFGALVVVRDGGYLDSARTRRRGGGADSIAGVVLAPGRAGTYDVRVTADGYAARVFEDIEVRETQCNIVPAERTALLIPD